MIVFENDNDLHLLYSCGDYPRVGALFLRQLIAVNLRQASHKKKRTIAVLFGSYADNHDPQCIGG